MFTTLSSILDASKTHLISKYKNPRNLTNNFQPKSQFQDPLYTISKGFDVEILITSIFTDKTL